MSKNMSAFAVEMDDIALMLQYSGSRTLLVIDELARSEFFYERMMTLNRKCLTKIAPVMFLSGLHTRQA
ncbi:unnamed protein product [Heligmosomoides polygyrus]|uniref:Uncharacterized protein n=1 Tax=Heligmosomoides polygyrus TaxID=6339 RepID=A0A3P8HME5_HELPZ|nr:unnamed protein product [Heligmosomoides polygyrus]